MKTEKFDGRFPTKSELLWDYKRHPEEFDPDGFYICTLDTGVGGWIMIRLGDGLCGFGGYRHIHCDQYVRQATRRRRKKGESK